MKSESVAEITSRDIEAAIAAAGERFTVFHTAASFPNWDSYISR